MARRTLSGLAWLASVSMVAVVSVGCSSSSSPAENLGGDAGTDTGLGSPDEGFTLDTAALGDTPATGESGPTSDVLNVTIRDFKFHDPADPSTDPDFENSPKTDASGAPSTTYLGPWDDRAIVADALGADGKPVYKSPGGVTLTTHGKDAFDKWYRDAPGTNLAVAVPLHLTKNPDGSFEYDSEKTGVPLSATDPIKQFFPIDDGTPYATAFGNQGKPHNYSFTVELRTTFVYKGGEFFNFRGDDDVFVYVDKKLVINLGGIHGPETANVKVDDLGLTKGNEYPLDFFSAERHVTGSNILFQTTLDLKPAVVK